MELGTVDDKGLSIASLEGVLAHARQLVNDAPALGPDADLSEGTPLGQWVGVGSGGVAKALQLLVLVVEQLDPNAASGVFLDRLCALTGTTRSGPIKSTVAVELAGDADTDVDAGEMVRHDPTETLWETIEAVNTGAGGSVSTILRALEPGPIVGQATSDWTPVGSLPGITGVSSIADIVPGSLTETDAELREKRERELSASNTTSSAGSVSTLVSDNEGITAASVVENNELVAVDGVDAQSVEYIVEDGSALTSDQVAEAIHKARPAGTRTSGLESGTFVDEYGISHTYRFSRPVLVEMHARVTLKKGPVDLPEDWEALLNAQIVKSGNAVRRGAPLVSGLLASEAFGALPAGSVTGVTVPLSRDGSVFQEDVFDLLQREKASFVDSRVEVV